MDGEIQTGSTPSILLPIFILFSSPYFFSSISVSFVEDLSTKWYMSKHFTLYAYLS